MRASTDPVPIGCASGPRPAKVALAGLLGRAGMLWADRALRARPFVVAAHYHGTPESSKANLARHFEVYGDEFECLDEEALRAFLAGARRLARPGLVLSFDDGLADHADVAAPLLESFGLRGWFMIPGGFLDRPADFDGATAGPMADGPRSEAQARPMTWDAARSLVRRGHVIGCHTWSHRTLGPGSTDALVDEEVVRARERLEDRIDHAVRTFAWVRGRPQDHGWAAQRAITRHFDLSFLSLARAIVPGCDPHRLHRFNVEASYPVEVVRFQMSRFNEALFARRRRAAHAALEGTPNGAKLPSP